MFKYIEKVKIKHIVIISLILVLIITGVFAILFSSEDETVVFNPAGIFFNEPSFLFSIYGEGEEVLRAPVAVDAASDGSIFIADAAAKDIKVFDENGQFKYKFNKLGDREQLLAPVGLSVDEETVYVTDVSKNQIFKFDLKGNFIGTLISPETKTKLTAFSPVGIEVSNKNIYFTDILFHQIIVTDLSGKLIKTIGGPGEQEGRLAYPNDIAIAPDQKLYVSDSNNFRVQESKNGQQLQLFKNGNASPAISSLVRGIAVDKDGYVWVVDAMNHQVIILDRDGDPVYVIGEMSSFEEQLSYPNGIDISSDRIYITDKGNRRVQVYKQ